MQNNFFPQGISKLNEEADRLFSFIDRVEKEDAWLKQKDNAHLLYDSLMTDIKNFMQACQDPNKRTITWSNIPNHIPEDRKEYFEQAKDLQKKVTLQFKEVISSSK